VRLTTALVRDFAPGEGDATRTDGEWLTVPVPGDVHSALIEARRIPHPFRDRHEGDCAWMEEREWWYRLAYDVGEPRHLILHGLDTFATVFLDGAELGRHANMFRPAEFEVPAGAHELAIRFDPPSAHVGAPLEGQWAPNDHARVWMRKAQYGYGWDWGPRLPTIGLWQPVELVERRPVAVAVDTLDLAGLVRVRLDREATVRLAGIEQTGTTLYFEIPEPRLWWTHDLGEPHLYDLVIDDERHLKVGLRTIELDQSPDADEPGTRFFRFVLNGVPLFARGANWIPPESFIGAATPARYEHLLGEARTANMNMVRVWGGGVYEHDAFYETCDRLGLLVWQDFMFACGMYPEALADEVELEARHQVARLRTHPSLALWCGNNENQWIHERLYPGEHVPGETFYAGILPRVCRELDPGTPYWPGSPFGGDDHNGPQDGDVHNWSVWHGNRPGRRFGEPAEHDYADVAFERYADDLGRFISEFGTLSAPDRETLRRWIAPDQLYHRSPALDDHTKDTPKDKIDHLLRTVTGVTGDLDEFIDFSQLAQAEAMKFGVEHFRRRKPHCSGTLVWQLNDCWPVFSWALLDYHGFRKPAWWALKRAYAPVLASFQGSELWITNDTLEPVRDEAHVRLAGFDGTTFAEARFSFEVDPLESRPVGTLDADGGPERYLTVTGTSFERNRHFFVPIKDLRRERPRVEHHQDANTLRLRSDGYAYLVRLGLTDEHVHASDDCFELEPGEERTITLSSAAETRVSWL
jgi:beta-mannosidase